MPLAMSSRLPPRSRNALRLAAWAQRLEGPSHLGRRLCVGDLAEPDRRLVGGSERADVGRQTVLEVVRLLHEGDGLDAVGVAHGESQVPFLYLQLGLPQHVELHGRDAERACLA